MKPSSLLSSLGLVLACGLHAPIHAQTSDQGAGQAADQTSATQPARLNPNAKLVGLDPIDKRENEAMAFYFHGVDAQGRNTLAMSDSRMATFAFGHAFELGGQRYYSGFAFNTQALYGNPPTGSDTLARLYLSEATFVPHPSGGQNWKVSGSSPALGRFGMLNKPPVFDEARPIVSYTLGEKSGTRYLMAVPMIEETPSSRMRKYLVLSFAPRPGKDQLKEPSGWTALGNLEAGDINTHWCNTAANTAQVPCLDSTGTLEFVAREPGQMPDIHMRMQGTMLDDATGDARPVTEADTAHYRFIDFSEGYGYR